MRFEPWIEHDKRRGTYTVRWRNAEGKKCRDEHSWDKSSEAKKRLDIIRLRHNNNALGIHKKLPLPEAAEIFMRLHGPRLMNDQSRATYRNHLNRLVESFGAKTLDDFTYEDVVECWTKWIEQKLKINTANKYIMLLYCLFERFKFWNGMVPKVMPEKIALPELNPVAVAKEYLGRRRMSTSHLGRKRRVSEEELGTAKAWCMKNDPELWEAIKLAIWTALRKADLKKLNTGYTVKGIDIIQEKTGQPHVMPIELRHVPNFGNLRIRWDYLRGAMGWLQVGTPLHTTWHDLRHCAPSWLADGDFSGQAISQYLGHTNEKMSRTYTHPSGKALIPAVAFIKQKLDAI